MKVIGRWVKGAWDWSRDQDNRDAVKFWFWIFGIVTPVIIGFAIWLYDPTTTPHTRVEPESPVVKKPVKGDNESPAFSVEIINDYDHASSGMFNRIKIGRLGFEDCPPDRQLINTHNCFHEIPKGERHFLIQDRGLVRDIHVTNVDNGLEHQTICEKSGERGLYCRITPNIGDTALPSTRAEVD